MSSIREGLYPDTIVLISQGVVYLAALFCANKLIISPVLKLHLERKKRTIGAIAQSSDFEQKRENIEEVFVQKKKEVFVQAQLEKRKQVEAAEIEIQKLMSESRLKTEALVNAASKESKVFFEEEKTKLPPIVRSLSEDILIRLGLGFLAYVLIFKVSTVAFASSAHEGPTISMDSTVWPYFHFVLFLAVAFYSGSKILPTILANKRQRLKTELEVAKSSLMQAENTILDLEAQIKTFDSNINVLMEEFKKEGLLEGQKKLQEAQSLVEHLTQNAEKKSKEFFEKAKRDLRESLVDDVMNEINLRISQQNLGEIDRKFQQQAISDLKTELSQGGIVL